MSTVLPVVGFVGLGNMGMPMSSRLVAAGYSVLGFDLSGEARNAFAEHGGTPTDNIGTLVREVDLVVLMLPNSPIVEQVTSDEEFRSALRPGLTLIDMGSSEPLATRALAEDLARSSVALVDAPVSGGVRGAVEGKLTVMAGGGEGDVERVAPVLGHFGRVVRTGPVGSGHALKALNNLLSATHLWATSEAMLTGAQFGIDSKVMLDVFNGSSGRSGSTDNKWPNFILPGTYDSGFALHLMLKDIRTAVALANDLGVSASLGAYTAARWADAADGLPATADHTEIALWIADREVMHR